MDFDACRRACGRAALAELAQWLVPVRDCILYDASGYYATATDARRYIAVAYRSRGSDEQSSRRPQTAHAA